jgi:hypothetical protein
VFAIVTHGLSNVSTRTRGRRTGLSGRNSTIEHVCANCLKEIEVKTLLMLSAILMVSFIVALVVGTPGAFFWTCLAIVTMLGIAKRGL